MYVVRSAPAVTEAFSLAVMRADAGRASLTAAGELDLAAARPLAALLADQANAGRKFVRLDLSGVTFLDCSCLGVIVAAHRRLKALGGQLVLIDVSPSVLHLLTVTRLVDRLLIARVPPMMVRAAAP